MARYKVHATRLQKEYSTQHRMALDAIHKELLAQTGAVHWITEGLWGGQAGITQMIYPANDDSAKKPHMIVTGQHSFNLRHCVSVRGDGNKQAGRELNAVMAAANRAINLLPSFSDWLVHVHYNVRGAKAWPHPARPREFLIVELPDGTPTPDNLLGEERL